MNSIFEIWIPQAWPYFNLFIHVYQSWHHHRQRNRLYYFNKAISTTAYNYSQDYPILTHEAIIPLSRKLPILTQKTILLLLSELLIIIGETVLLLLEILLSILTQKIIPTLLMRLSFHSFKRENTVIDWSDFHLQDRP